MGAPEGLTGLEPSQSLQDPEVDEMDLFGRHPPLEALQPLFKGHRLLGLGKGLLRTSLRQLDGSQQEGCLLALSLTFDAPRQLQ